MKLEYKLSFMFAALMLIAGIVLIIINTYVVKSELEQSLISREQIGMELLGKKLSPYFIDKNYAGMTGAIFEEKGVKKELVEYISVYGPDNKLIAHTFLDRMPDAVRIEEEPGDFLVEQHIISNMPVIEISAAVKDGSYEFGRIYVGYKSEYIENTLFYISLLLTVEIIFVVFFTVMLGALLFKRIIVKPITELEKTIADISGGNLDKRVSINTGDELENLAKSFNKMTSDLKESRSNIEQQVEVKTKELSDKMSELTETKNAVLNIMEDTEELNRSLVDTQERLNKSVVELKKLDLEKDKFISIAAHELKTPMTAIHGFTQLLEDEKTITNPQARNKYLKIIEGEIDRLARLVTEVLDLSRIDVGALKLAIEDVDIPEMMNAITETLLGKAMEKNLALGVKIEPKLPKLQTDKEKLREIVINLISNSIKYTEKGSINVSVSKEGGNIRFSVADTGIGIPKEHFGKMFTRFYQVESPLTRVAGSTGLGLSICKEFVEALGGKIWFDSILGKGSTFYVALPIKWRGRQDGSNGGKKEQSE